MTRLMLCQKLHKRTGLGLRQCLPLVYEFCDRHGIFPKSRSWVWLSLLMLLMAEALPLSLLTEQFLLSHQLATAHTRALRHLILMQHIKTDKIFLFLIVPLYGIWLIVLIWIKKSQQRQARAQFQEAQRILRAIP